MNDLRMGITWWLIGIAINVSPKRDPEAQRLYRAINEVATTSPHLDQRESVEFLRSRVDLLEGLVRWAHDTLYEINPLKYDHGEVRKLNDASVEVILGLAPVLGESHGKSAEWWQARAALSTAKEGK